MNAPTKLLGFGLALVFTFGAAFGVGRAVGPLGDDPSPAGSVTTSTTAPHGGDHP